MSNPTLKQSTKMYVFHLSHTVTIVALAWGPQPSRSFPFCSQFPLHRHSDVHFNAAFTHLQCPTHLFWHPHFSSSEHEAAASGSTVQLGSHLSVGLLLHPQELGDGTSGDRTCICPHTNPAWCTARLVCSNRAASVGGIASIGLPFAVNMYFLAKSTLTSEDVLSYNRITNFSNGAIFVSSNSLGEAI